MLEKLKSVLKNKVKFVSEHPPIKSQKQNLKNIETWLNELITNKGFNTESLGSRVSVLLGGYHYGMTSGSIIMDNTLKTEMDALGQNNQLKINNKKKFKCIFDASVERNLKTGFATKFHLSMRVDVIWSHFYSYEVGDVGYILDEPEVPAPFFLYDFYFSEYEWDKEFLFKTGYAKKVYWLNDGTDTSYRSDPINKDDHLTNFEDLKNRFENFVSKIKQQILKYDIDIWEVQNLEHPINVKFRKEKLKLTNNK